MHTRRDILKLLGLTVAAGACPGCASSAAGSSTGSSWSRHDLEILTTAAGRNGAIGWAAWQGGRRLAGSRADERGPTLSITKSIATLAATRAAAEGWLSPAEKVSATLTEWRADALKSRITVLMLLQQVSGLEAGVVPLYRNHPADKGRAAIALHAVDSPGGVFRYGPGHWEVLAEVMKRKLAFRGQSLENYLSRAVMRPVGLSSANWRKDQQGTPYFSTGTELSVIELGRLGSTIGRLLDGRNSHGFDAAHYSQMTRPSRANPMFGGGLWRNTNATRPGATAISVEHSIDAPLPASFWANACLSPHQPPGLVALIGSSGRRVYIWPGGEKRAARLARSGSSWSDAEFLARLGAA